MRGVASICATAGAAMGMVGALLAMFVGTVGVFSGGDDDAGRQFLGGLIAALAAAGGGGAAFLALFKPRLAALLLLVAAVVGLAVATLYFVLGAVLLLAGSYMAFRADSLSNGA